MQKNMIILIASVFAITFIALSFGTGFSMPWCGEEGCDTCAVDSDCGTMSGSCSIGDEMCTCTYETSCKSVGYGTLRCVKGALVGNPENCVASYSPLKAPNFAYGQKNMTSKELEASLKTEGKKAIESDTVTSFIAYIKTASPCMPVLVNGSIKSMTGTSFRPAAGNTYLITVKPNESGDGFNAYFARLNGTGVEGNCTLAFCA